MIALVAGSLVLVVGVPFLVRGWIFFLKPEHAVSLKARERNLRLGIETDMKKWGRRVRRMGFMLTLSGVALTWYGWSSLG